MLRVLTKVATYVDNIWHGAGTEITIAEHHFSDEVHTLLEDLGLEKKPAPPVTDTPPAAPSHPTASPMLEPEPAAADPPEGHEA